MRKLRVVSYYLVHRLSYEAFKGPVPDGAVIDHVCRNTLCYNPDHLEAVSQKENVLRGALTKPENRHKARALPFCAKGACNHAREMINE